MKYQKIIIPVMAVICAAAVTVMTVVLLKGGGEKTVYQPPAFDTGAQNGTPVVDDSLGWSSIYQSGMSFSAHLCGKVLITDSRADLYFTNDKTNTVWMKLRILDESGNILAETGLLKPGQYLKSVKFSTLPSDGASVKLKIMAYEPDTYYSAGAVSLNTTVTIGGK